MKPGLLKAWQLVTCTVHHWLADNASTTGAALAFYCAFSLAPLLILILTLAGQIIGDAAANEEIASQLTAMIEATAQILMGAVRSSQHTKGGLSTVVSVITLLIGATTVFAALEAALEQIWNTDRSSAPEFEDGSGRDCCRSALFSPSDSCCSSR